MAAADGAPTKAKRRRAPRACAFCRQRKLRCDAQQPCSTCKAYDQSCDFQTKARKRSRPSEKSSSFHQDSAVVPAPSSPSYDTVSSLDGQNPSSPPAEGIRAESTYHGLTSTLFDDTQNARKFRPEAITTEWIQRGLMAEAAKQRQLEIVNYRAGSLDFDGVDPELGMHLLSLHWNRQHHSFMITYRPAFMRDMACGGPCFSKLLLNAIYYAASKFSPRPGLRRDPDDVRTAGWLYRNRVKELLVNALDSSEITTIQALLVMTNSLFALGDERSAAWLYAGMAFRMIIDLGMHVDTQSPRVSDMDLEIRRRVFWAAFVVDKIQSLYQGRPASLQEFDIRVPLTFNDNYEELEHWTPFAYLGGDSDYAGSPSYSISTFTELCKLCIIMNGILNKVYAEKSSNRRPEDMLKTLEALDVDLGTWHQALPPHLSFDPRKLAAKVPPPHVMSLIAMHHVLKILLHRPFVEDGHLHTSKPSTPRESFAQCATAATEIVYLLRRYDEAFSISRAPYLISYATYVAATIHVRIAAQRGPHSEAHASLQTCLAVFQKNQLTNSAVQKARLVIEKLIKKMGVDLAYQARQVQGAESLQMSQPRAASTPLSSARTPELDIEAIIQSFVRENGTQDGPISTYGLEGRRRPSTIQSVMAPHPFTTEAPRYSTVGVLVDANPYDNNISAGSMWNNLGNVDIDQAIPAFDDTLFGFNASSYDGIWYENIAP